MGWLCSGRPALAIALILSAFSALDIALSASPVSAGEEDIIEQGDKCLKYLPNIGRMIEVPCASGKKAEPEKQSEPATEPNPPAKPETPTQTGEVETPERGSPLRAELMNAARPVFEREIGGAILFQVRRIAVYGDWAFGNVHPTRATGAEIDWAATKFAADLKNGAFESDTSFFLLKREQGAWKVAETAIGPTDVAWDSWRQQYNLPAALFSP